jgi:hypothetical protein
MEVKLKYGGNNNSKPLSLSKDVKAEAETMHEES